MYLAGASVRRAEDVTEALWEIKVSPATISKLNKNEKYIDMKHFKVISSDVEIPG